jgi:plastocyanin
MTTIGRRRNDMPRRTIIAAGSIAALVFGLAACGGGDEAPTCENPQAATSVTMGDFFYEPSCVEVTPGAELEIVNEGQAPHTFTVEADAGEPAVDVPAGETATLAIPALDAGTYRVVCTYHPQMEGALRVPPPA